MKKLPALLAATLLASFLPNAPAQTPPSGNARRIIRPDAAKMPPESTDASKNLTRFDLDFPGGTPAELAAAIVKASGRPLNLIISPSAASRRIMPLKLNVVTVPELFQAVGDASRQMSAFTYVENGKKKVDGVDTSLNFQSVGGQIREGTVWWLNFLGPNEEMLHMRSELDQPPPVTRYFQLAPYLENYSIEDITTAIQTGWKMAKVDPTPQLSFHRETQLLIAVGPEVSVKEIPDVLNALRLDRGPTLDRMVKLQAQLDEILAKPGGGDDKEAATLRQKIHDLALRQNANEQIDSGISAIFRPSRVNTR